VDRLKGIVKWFNNAKGFGLSAMTVERTYLFTIAQSHLTVTKASQKATPSNSRSSRVKRDPKQPM